MARGERKLLRGIGGGATPAGITIVSRPSGTAVGYVVGATYGVEVALDAIVGATGVLVGDDPVAAATIGVVVCGAGSRGTAGSK